MKLLIKLLIVFLLSCPLAYSAVDLDESIEVIESFEGEDSLATLNDVLRRIKELERLNTNDMDGRIKTLEGVGKFKVGSLTTSGSSCTDDVETGVGFKPSALVLFAALTSGGEFTQGHFVTDCTTDASTTSAHDGSAEGGSSTSTLKVLNGSAATVYEATVTCDTDGFTLNDTTDSAAIVIVYLAFI